MNLSLSQLLTIDLITTKVIKFQNFGEPGSDEYVLLEVCRRDSDPSGKITDFIEVSQTVEGCQLLENIENRIFRFLKG